MVNFVTRGKPDEFVVRSTALGSAEDQAIAVLVALREAAGAMVATLRSRDEVTRSDLEYFLGLRKIRQAIQTELAEIDAALELAESKVLI